MRIIAWSGITYAPSVLWRKWLLKYHGQTYRLIKPKVRAHSHQGHGLRADLIGWIHICDFRYPAKSLLLTAADHIFVPQAEVSQASQTR